MKKKEWKGHDILLYYYTEIHYTLGWPTCNFLPIYQSSLVRDKPVMITTPALVWDFINWLLCKSSTKVEICCTDSNHQDWLLNIKGVVVVVRRESVLSSHV